MAIPKTGSSGSTGGAPQDTNAPPKSSHRNDVGPHNPFKGADAFGQKLSPAKQVADSGKAHEQKLMGDSDTRRKETDAWHDHLKEGAVARHEAQPDFSKNVHDPDYWKKLDEQYSPDSNTLASKGNSEFEKGLAINKESTQFESGLAAFENEGGAAGSAPEGVSSAAMGTLEASKTA